VKIEPLYKPKIDSLDKDITALTADFDKRLAEGAPLSEAEKRELEDRRDRLQKRYDETDKASQERIDTASGQVNEALKAEADNAKQNSEQQTRRDDVLRQLGELEKRRIEDARLDQVRRIAGRIYGRKPEDVTSDQSGVISVFWFGSLALLAALAGPMTALVALALQSLSVAEEKRMRGGKLSHLVRRILLHWRWRRVRTVLTYVEVPVEKEVEKRVEVQVERVVKEILYVPILTDDPDEIRRALDQTLDRGIADIVRISVAGSGSGNSSQYKTA